MSEKLKWFFETTKNTISGANDPIHETFRAHPYYSIVRESIQNSMDVRLDETKPVRVKFETISINQAEHNELFSIRENIESCLEFHKNNKQARDLYGGMLRYLDENPSVKILKVSDYNTRGMHFDKEDHLCPFTSFMGEGISSKQTGEGGSFGFGKGAYYVPSELRTILVSTMIENNQVFFQGRTRLASHRINDEIKGKDGVFRINDSEPIQNEEEISVMFRREEQGTDVYILGMRDDPNCGKEMVKSVLNNFWLAVHENRLDVVIKTDDVNITFDETNLEDIMNQYFPEENEHGTISEIYQWNPRAYYKAVKYANLSEDFILFEEDVHPIGNVRFYVYRKEGLPNRICFMRKPAMTVYKTSRSILSGYSASFVCDNDIGNEILRQMENAAHNEWKPENVRYVDHNKRDIYYRAKDNINYFIRTKLKEISGVSNTNKMEISGLSQYLSIPEELLDQHEHIPGSSANSSFGSTNHVKTDKETGNFTTINQEVTIVPNYVNKNDLTHPGGVGENASLYGGNNNGSSGGDKLGEGTSNIESKGGDLEGEKRTGIIDLKLRVAAVKQEGTIIHNLIVYSERYYDNVSLMLSSGTDNGEDSQLQIDEVNNGIPDHGEIKNVRLEEGKNIISVKFSDTLKHTIKLKAYEV